MTGTEEQVRAAAAALVDAFGRHDAATYFASFSPEATFTFYTVPEPLRSRAAYEKLWSEWERNDAFRVLSCVSTEQHVQVLGETAVFTHRVQTQVSGRVDPEALDERETIVFARQVDGSWLAVHEHLSPAAGQD